MEKKLPKNWVETELGNIVLPRKGKKPNVLLEDEIENTIPYILIDQLEGRQNRLYTTDKNVTIVDKNDVLVVWDGSIGKNGSGLRGALGSTLVSMTPLGKIPTKFIEYIIKEKQNFIKETSTGVGLQHINKNFFKECFIPLPPLPEQERIVAKLDLLFAQHEKIKTSLEKIPQILKDFRQQILTQAVTGKLINPKFIGKLEDYEIKIITGPFGSSLHKSDYVNAGIPVINPSHILNGEIVPDERVTIDSQTFHKLSAWKLVKGDVILGRRGEMGRAAPFSGSTEMLCGTGSIILRSDKVNSQFLAYYLRSELCVKYLNENSVGSTMVNLNQGILKSLPIPIYTIKEQNEIVKKVEKLFLKSEIILNKYQKLKEKIDQLPQTILHKAFKGELVPQLPTDGDAKDLLKEILALKKEGKKK